MIGREYTAITKELAEMDREMWRANEDCVSRQEGMLMKVKSLKEQTQEVLESKARVGDRNLEIAEELEKYQRKVARLGQDLGNLTQFISVKKQFKDQLLLSVKSHESKESSLASLLVQAKSDLLDVQSFYQEFQVRIIKMLIPLSCKLILKKSSEDDYTLELQYANKVESISFHDIDDIADHATKDNRFIISAHNKSKEIVSDQKKKILSRIRELMQRCIKL